MTAPLDFKQEEHSLCAFAVVECVPSLTTNKRITVCVLSLVFVAKCSHKLGELPAGVRGMDIVVRLFYLLVLFISSVTS